MYLNLIHCSGTTKVFSNHRPPFPSALVHCLIFITSTVVVKISIKINARRIFLRYRGKGAASLCSVLNTLTNNTISTINHRITFRKKKRFFSRNYFELTIIIFSHVNVPRMHRNLTHFLVTLILTHSLPRAWRPPAGAANIVIGHGALQGRPGSQNTTPAGLPTLHFTGANQEHTATFWFGNARQAPTTRCRTPAGVQCYRNID